MNEHKPVLYIFQDGNQFFAALPDFVDLQESEVAWVEQEQARTALAILRGQKNKSELAQENIAFKRAQRTDTEKDAILERATSETIDPHSYGGGL